MTLHIVYATGSGQAVSYGTLVADPLPAGLAAYPCSEADEDGLDDHTLMWDPATRAVVPRVLTPEEQAEATRVANEAVLVAETTTEIATLLSTIDTLNTVIGPSGAAAGTTSLRALRAQTNTAVVNATSIKALIDYDITVAREARRVARQAIRVARLTVGATDSTSSGTETT